ncbi:MAG: 6-bladed beta-propeller [Gemmatimonadales bacterium]
MRHTAIVGMILAYLAACDSGDVPPPPEMIPDPAQVGLPLAEVPASDRSHWLGSGDWALEPVSSFAATMDDTVLVHTINTLRPGPDGLLYLGLQGQASLTVVTPEGRFIRRIGRRGSGPGEFEGHSDSGWRNDSLWVLDARLGRLSWFDREGEFLGSIQRDPRGAWPTSTGDYLHITSWNVLNTSTLIAYQGSDASPPAGIKHLHWSRGGFSLRAGEQSYRMGVHPMADTPLISRHPLGEGLMVLELPASGSTVRLTRIGPDGATEWEGVVDLPTQPLTAAEWEEFLRLQYEGSNIDPVALAAAVPRSHHWVPATSAILATDARLLVRGPTYNTDRVTWTMISPEGRVLGASTLPADLRVMYVSGDTLWGVRPNEDDLDVVTRYRMRR